MADEVRAIDGVTLADGKGRDNTVVRSGDDHFL